jgi:hypothetical protein
MEPPSASLSPPKTLARFLIAEGDVGIGMRPPPASTSIGTIVFYPYNKDDRPNAMSVII